MDYPKSRRPYMMRDGSTQSVKVKVHPDRRVQAVVEQVREAEMLQAIDRLRLIHSHQKKTVVILCNILSARKAKRATARTLEHGGCCGGVAAQKPSEPLYISY